MATPLTAYGTKLQLSIASVFTDIAAVRRFGAPSLERETIDATHLQSANNAREFLGSLRNGGEFTMQILFDPGETTHKALTTAMGSTAADSWKIVWPDASTSTDWPFSGWVTGFEVTGELGDLTLADLTVKITGWPTLPT